MKKFSNLFTLLLAFVVVAALAACTSTDAPGTEGTTTETPEQSTTVESSTTQDGSTTEHVHVFDQQVPTKAYQKSAATCTEAAVYYYSCVDGEMGTETFTYGEPLGHSWDEGTVETAATCTTAGKKVYVCSRCNETREEVIDALGHTFEDTPAGWTTASGVAIKYHCTTCNKYFDAEKNELEFTVPEATYTTSVSVENGVVVVTKTPTADCAAFYDAITYTSSDQVTTLTIEQAASNSLQVAEGEYSDLVLISGTVASVTNTTYGNGFLYVATESGFVKLEIYGAAGLHETEDANFKFTFDEENKTVTVERSTKSAKTFATDGADGGQLFKAGDTVQLLGWLQNYKNKDGSTKMEIVKSLPLSITAGELTGSAHLTVEADENVESVKFLVNGAEVAASAVNIGDAVTMVVTPKEGFVLDKVTATNEFGVKVNVSDELVFTALLGTKLSVVTMGDGVVKTEPTVVTAPVAGKSYRLGTYQAGLTNPDWYFVTGQMSGYYGASVNNYDDAMEVKVETTEGGFYLVCSIDGAKKYISVTVSGEHYNFSYVDQAGLVWSYDATKKMLVANAGTAETPDMVFMGMNGTYTTAGGYQIVKLESTGYYGFNLYEFENRPALEKVELGQNSFELSEEETAQLEIVYTPASASKLTWTFASTDPTIATVSATGLITAVKAGETTVTATSGDIVLTATVKVKAIQLVGGTAKLIYSDTTTTTNMTEGNNAATLGLDSGIFTVTGNKNDASNFPGLNKAGHIRLYGAASKNGSGFTVTINDKFVIKTAKVTFGATVNLVSVNGGEEFTPTANQVIEYTVNGQTFSIKNTVASTKQVYVVSVEFVYDVAGGTTPVEPTLAGVKLFGASTNELTLDSETGLYVGTFKMSRQWSSVGFSLVYSDDSVVKLGYANATFSGDGICSARVSGSTETAQLFVDSDDLENARTFCYALTTETNYKVTVNAETKAVTVNVLAPAGLSYSGTTTGVFTAVEGGTYYAVVSLAKWNSISFTYSDGNGNNTTLWYDNTTFSGSVTGKDVTGDQWDGKLYHEAEGKVFYVGQDSNFELTYNPTTKTMEVKPYFDFTKVAGVAATTSTGSVVTFTKTENNTFYGVFTLQATWNNVVFTATDSANCKLVLSYNNTTFGGNGVNSAASGATWTTVLYSEADNTKGEFYLSTDGPAVYEASYDPATKTMTITLHVHEYTQTVDYSTLGEGYFTTTSACTCGDSTTGRTFIAKYDVVANITAFNSSSSSNFTPSLENKSVAYTGAPAAGGSIWCRFDFTACTTTARYAYIVLQGDTEGTNVGVKFDGLSGSNNNMYDGTTGNKTWKALGTNTIVVVWDLQALGMDSTKLEKVVFWPYGTSATGTIKVLSAGLFNVLEDATAPSAIVNE